MAHPPELVPFAPAGASSPGRAPRRTPFPPQSSGPAASSPLARIQGRGQVAPPRAHSQPPWTSRQPGLATRDVHPHAAHAAVSAGHLSSHTLRGPAGPSKPLPPSAALSTSSPRSFRGLQVVRAQAQQRAKSAAAVRGSTIQALPARIRNPPPISSHTHTHQDTGRRFENVKSISDTNGGSHAGSGYLWLASGAFPGQTNSSPFPSLESVKTTSESPAMNAVNAQRDEMSRMVLRLDASAGAPAMTAAVGRDVVAIIAMLMSQRAQLVGALGEDYVPRS